MIDPENITKFDRTPLELEEFFLFGMFVCGKNAHVQAKKLEELRIYMNVKRSWKAKIRGRDDLYHALYACRVGQYGRLCEAMWFWKHKTRWDLATCTVEDLMDIPGVGPKTSRFFLLHSRPNQKLAVLDTHVLAWLRDRHSYSIPTSTPGKRKYAELEKTFLYDCETLGKTPAELDLEIWTEYSGMRGLEIERGQR